MTSPDERKGENESFFRELNERLEQHAAEKQAAERTFQAVCECSRESCTDRVAVPFAEYEAVRAHPTRFILATGHADAGCERVVQSGPEYDVVEKFGVAAVVAAEHDPRSDE